MIRASRISEFMLFVTIGALVPALAAPPPIGSILGSKNAILDGQRALSHTTVLSGDNLRVTDGIALVTLNQGNRMVLGGQSEASFLQEADGVMVSLKRGNVSLLQSATSTGVQVKVGDITVAPVQGEKTLGEIAMADGFVVVTAKDGRLRVDGNGSTQEVSKGKTITLATETRRAPVPSPSGNRHLNRKRVKTAAMILGGGAAVALAIALTRSGAPACPQNQASPSTPPPPNCQ